MRNKIKKEILKNKRLMKFNAALTLKEQTDTLTITSHMFDSILDNERYRPLVDEGIQGELDKVRKDDLGYVYFGRVKDFVSKPTPAQVDLNPFWEGATDLPCPICLAYAAAKDWALTAGLSTLTLQDIDGEQIKFKAKGWVGISDLKLELKATLRANYWLKDDYLYFSIDDVNISAPYQIPLYPFKVKLSYSKIKITNNTWCDGTCWSIDPGLEDEIKDEFGTQKINIRPYIDEMGS